MIINVAIGEGYEAIQDRMARSLALYGYMEDILLWKDFPNDNYDKKCVYNVKAAAFEEAVNRGYTNIMWLDCSFYATRPITPILDIIKEDGYYLIENGFTAAQECNDRCLEYFGITRDEAENIRMLSSGIMGMNTEKENCRNFVNMFIQSAKDGIFAGSRTHDGQSSDPRFLWHRQDQSCASIIAYKLGMKIHKLGEHVGYKSPDCPESVVLKIQGV